MQKLKRQTQSAETKETDTGRQNTIITETKQKDTTQKLNRQTRADKTNNGEDQPTHIARQSKRHRETKQADKMGKQTLTE